MEIVIKILLDPAQLSEKERRSLVKELDFHVDGIVGNFRLNERRHRDGTSLDYEVSTEIKG